MNKKKNLNNLWWLDCAILNLQLTNFKYSKINNIFNINIQKNIFFFFFLINKKNLNSYLFYILDSLLINNNNNKTLYISYQSIYFDYKVLIETYIKNEIQSLSHILKGTIWIERELKEFSNIPYSNLLDTRKLLSNYNYNNILSYNNYNNIINDIKI